MTEYTGVDYIREGMVATITMRRPEVMNALDRALRRELLEVIQHAEKDPGVRVLILTGEGAGFCTGADLNAAASESGVENIEEVVRDEFNPIVAALAGCRKPVIAAVNGPAVGAGGSLALACDLVAISESAYFLQAFTMVGLVPDCGMVWSLSRTIGYQRTFEIIADPKPVFAKKCLELGLVNRVTPDENLLADTMAWAQRIAEGAPLALQEAKRILRYGMTGSLPEVLEKEAKAQGRVVHSRDVQEGVLAFLEKRKAVFNGN
ncbi:enoyl-CoA hydratase/isomerase family protein [Emcibacter nanhaiensis]|uniref:Enoyl-CoA hydratase n=1 Tax=Emcibacter nanhaiensis TaxID=1505037 RepID=A0A501PFM8_9PROT|nr:enoyl-CoA hydratase-related protein [Emcibacter nanhaiensis]TPD59269.1 hypothetical protein FIV46_10755 [Emcibacter nanhaiensis]